MVIQTENNKLWKKALSEGPTYNDFVKAGTAMESSNMQATKMEKGENINRLVHNSKSQRTFRQTRYQKSCSTNSL